MRASNTLIRTPFTTCSKTSSIEGCVSMRVSDVPGVPTILLVKTECGNPYAVHGPSEAIGDMDTIRVTLVE